MPVQRRSDFKQALSTLQQLKEKEEEAQRNQRWAQSFFFFSSMVELARFLVDPLF